MPFPFLSKSVDFNKSLKLPSACEVLLILPSFWELALLHGSQELRLPKIEGLISASGLKVEAMDSLRIIVGFGDIRA